MVLKESLSIHGLVVAGLLIALATAPAFSRQMQTQQYPAQQPTTQQQPAKPQQNTTLVSQEELDAYKKVEQGADADTRLKAAADFVKKYPKSTAMKQVAMLVAGKIDEVKDGPQKITFSQTYQGIFKGPEEAAIIQPVLLDAYIKANRLDDAFQLGATDIQQNPNDVETVTRLALVAYDEVRKKDTKYVTQGFDYDSKAIALIEADKKPARLTEQQWTDYKTRILAALYQEGGYFLLATGKPNEAEPKLEKAASINPTDAFTFVLLGAVANQHYEDLAKNYKGMPPGPAQDAALKEALTAMDKVIDLYAHAVALTEGNAVLQALHDGVLQELTTLYKYKHNNTTDGLQQLIDKYKRPAAAAAPGH